MVQEFVAFAIALGFAGIHLFGARLRPAHAPPRSAWLSAAGGVAVAYVFVHLLPELAEHQRTFEEKFSSRAGLLARLESHTYLIALAGLSVFYGLDHFARTSAKKRKNGEPNRPSRGVFWVHLGAFAVYNVVIGYLLINREEGGLRSLLIFGFAMALHFIVNDQALRETHGAAYQHRGRWVLAAAPVSGVLIAWLTEIPDLALAALFAFLGGGIVLNVLKEELPEDRENRFWAFALGAGGYAVLLLATQ